jgi:hypothetical protein
LILWKRSQRRILRNTTLKSKGFKALANYAGALWLFVCAENTQINSKWEENKMEENKVYTFEFRYFDPDYNIGTSVQFCAEDIEEAKDLFSDYLLENYSGGQIVPSSVGIVYNGEDHDAYGESYGMSVNDDDTWFDISEVYGF